MSKIFDVLKKDNLVDFGELCESEMDLAREQQEGHGHSICRVNDTSLPRNSTRIVQLRLSVLSPFFPFDNGQNAAGEQYRIIRTKILHSCNKPRLIVVSSASSGDGKTVTSINIAASLALKDGSRVLLVDGDLRRPRISDALGLPVAPGLTEVLSGVAELESALVRAEQFPNLFILPAGNSGESAAELLDSERWRLLIKQIRERFTNVLFDTPPIATVADYELVQLVCDGTIVIARPDHSDRAACVAALGIVPKEKLLGVVLNCVEDWWLWKTPAYGYYRKQVSERTP
jgi:capsular exopolysaccharide synthesis family protein